MPDERFQPSNDHDLLIALHTNVKGISEGVRDIRTSQQEMHRRLETLGSDGQRMQDRVGEVERMAAERKLLVERFLAEYRADKKDHDQALEAERRARGDALEGERKARGEALEKHHTRIAKLEDEVERRVTQIKVLLGILALAWPIVTATIVRYINQLP